MARKRKFDEFQLYVFSAVMFRKLKNLSSQTIFSFSFDWQSQIFEKKYLWSIAKIPTQNYVFFLFRIFSVFIFLKCDDGNHASFYFSLFIRNFIAIFITNSGVKYSDWAKKSFLARSSQINNVLIKEESTIAVKPYNRSVKGSIEGEGERHWNL
jgi:hypothetical protein